MTRMQCTRCFATRVPDTVVDGSDWAEIAGWLCLALPGWAYCAWRHALRRRACATCGSDSLIREAQARQRLEPALEPGSGWVRSARGPSPWPRALAHPRQRLRHGGVGAALPWVTALTVWLGPPGPFADIALGLGAALGAAWLTHQLRRVARQRATTCFAVDDTGRALRVEAL